MKKTILSLIALIAITGFTTANYTGNVSDYYESNKAEYSLNVSNLGNITVTTPVYGNDINYGKNVIYLQSKVLCKVSTNMCYSQLDLMRSFGFDADAFVRGYEKVTGNTTNFVNLFKALGR